VDRGSPLFPESPNRHRIHRGLITERQEHIFTWIAVGVLLGGLLATWLAIAAGACAWTGWRLRRL